jgi:FMN phosphatase YigB (HAD superfamily)
VTDWATVGDLGRIPPPQRGRIRQWGRYQRRTRRRQRGPNLRASNTAIRADLANDDREQLAELDAVRQEVFIVVRVTAFVVLLEGQ